VFVVLSSCLSKANGAEILGDYEIDISVSAEQLLQLMLKYARNGRQVTQDQQLHQVKQHSISTISSSSIETNVKDFVGTRGVPMNGRADVVKRRIFSPSKCERVINLNAVLTTVDRKKLDEMGEEQLMEYFAREFNPNILDQGFQF
jgi:hypothetical protein